MAMLISLENCSDLNWIESLKVIEVEKLTSLLHYNSKITTS